MFVLDTHVISELRHGKPHQSLEVRSWAGAQSANQPAVLVSHHHPGTG